MLDTELFGFPAERTLAAPGGMQSVHDVARTDERQNKQKERWKPGLRKRFILVSVSGPRRTPVLRKAPTPGELGGDVVVVWLVL